MNKQTQETKFIHHENNRPILFILENGDDPSHWIGIGHSESVEEVELFTNEFKTEPINKKELIDYILNL